LTGIVIEGLDLTGKSSIAQALAELIGHIRVVESPQSRYRTLLHTSAPPLSPIGRLALYISANIELGRDFLQPNHTIIAVRYFLSTVTYHAIASQESATHCMHELDYLIRHCPLPDALIIVEASHQERLKRASEISPSLSESDNWTLGGDIHSRLTKSYHEITELIDVPVLFLDTTAKDSGSVARTAFDWLRSLNLV
jgi:thymidylate kinase